jgi:hypothetical protein
LDIRKDKSVYFDGLDQAKEPVADQEYFTAKQMPTIIPSSTSGDFSDNVRMQVNSLQKQFVGNRNSNSSERRSRGRSKA